MIYVSIYAGNGSKSVPVYTGNGSKSVPVYTGNGSKSVPVYTENCCNSSANFPCLRAGAILNRPQDEKFLCLVSDPHQFVFVPVVYTGPQLQRIQTDTPRKVIPTESLSVLILVRIRLDLCYCKRGLNENRTVWILF